MKKNILLKSILIIVSIIANYTTICSQTIEEIYYQLPVEYIRSCPLGRLSVKNGDVDRKKLRELLKMKTSEFNKIPDNWVKLGTKTIDNKNGYLKFCDGDCIWEFIMKIFNGVDTNKKCVAIWEGNNDGATSGTNKEFHFLQVIKKKHNKISFKDVTQMFIPTVTYKEVIDSRKYKKYKQSIDKYFLKDENLNRSSEKGENLLDEFELHRNQPSVTGYVNSTGMLFFDEKIPKEIEDIVEVISKKTVLFKWNGKKFIHN